MSQNPVADRQGYLTVAVRSRLFLELAVDLALSLREHDPDRGVSLVTDARLRPVAERVYGDVFQHVFDLPEVYSFGRARKFCVADATPYSETLFVDADTLALTSAADLWDALSGTAMAMVGQMLPADDRRLHHGKEVSDLCRTHGLQRYFKSNSSMFFIAGQEGQRILDACFRVYRDEVYRRFRWSPDEMAFGVLGGREGMSVISTPQPFPWPEELARLHLDAPAWPFYTALALPRTEVMARLMATVSRRRTQAGLPDCSEACWRLKTRTLSRAAQPEWVRALRKALLNARLALFHHKRPW